MEIIFISDVDLKKFENKLIETANKYKVLHVKEARINGYFVAGVLVEIQGDGKHEKI